MLVGPLASDRGERQAARTGHGVGQAVRGGGRGEGSRLRVQRRGPLGAPGFEIVRDGEAEPVLGAHGREHRPRQQIVLEGAEGAGALDPYVARPQPVAQVHEDGDLPGTGVELGRARADALAPAALGEDDGHLGRRRPPLAAVQGAQDLDGGQDRVFRLERAQHEGLEQHARGAPQHEAPGNQLVQVVPLVRSERSGQDPSVGRDPVPPQRPLDRARQVSALAARVLEGPAQEQVIAREHLQRLRPGQPAGLARLLGPAMRGRDHAVEHPDR